MSKSKPKNLNELHNINKTIVGILERADLTVEELATADARKLQKLPGIGFKTAESIIKAAQAAVNQKLLKESQFLDRPQAIYPGNDNIQRSVRVQRIMDAHARGELI